MVADDGPNWRINSFAFVGYEGLQKRPNNWSLCVFFADFENSNPDPNSYLNSVTFSIEGRNKVRFANKMNIHYIFEFYLLSILLKTEIMLKFRRFWYLPQFFTSLRKYSPYSLFIASRFSGKLPRYVLRQWTLILILQPNILWFCNNFSIKILGLFCFWGSLFQNQLVVNYIFIIFKRAWQSFQIFFISG